MSRPPAASLGCLKQAPQNHPERTNRAYIYFIAKVKPFGLGLRPVEKSPAFDRSGSNSERAEQFLNDFYSFAFANKCEAISRRELSNTRCIVGRPELQARQTQSAARLLNGAGGVQN
jgi:hypothetical protein